VKDCNIEKTLKIRSFIFLQILFILKMVYLFYFEQVCQFFPLYEKWFVTNIEQN